MGAQSSTPSVVAVQPLKPPERTNYVQGELIGTGGLSNVFSGSWNETRVAIKKYVCFDLLSVDRFVREICAYRKLRHANIAQYYAHDSPSLSIILELLPSQTLRTLVKGSIIPLQESLNIAIQLSSTVSFIHKLGVTHNDIKSANVMIAQQHPLCIKLIDFESSVILEDYSRNETQIDMSKVALTERWAPPERLNRKCLIHRKDIFKIDVFSFGMVMYELVTGLLPFDDIDNNLEIADKYSKGERPKLPTTITVPEVYKNLMMKCWYQIPNLRPSISDVNLQLKDMRDTLGLSLTIEVENIGDLKDKTTEKQQPSSPKIPIQQPSSPNISTQQPSSPNIPTQQPSSPNITQQPSSPNIPTQQPSSPNIPTQQPSSPNKDPIQPPPPPPNKDPVQPSLLMNHQNSFNNDIAESWYPSVTWNQTEGSLFSTSPVTPGSDLHDKILTQLQTLSSERGYTVLKIELIKNQTLLTRFNEKLNSLEFFRNTSPFANTDLPEDGEKQAILDRFKNMFVSEGRFASLQKANVALMWHGCSPEACHAICSGGAKDLRRTDGGYFGGGIYLTPNCEYAAQYTMSPTTHATTRTIILCLACVGLTYPVSRATDYDDAQCMEYWNVSKFHPAYPVPRHVVESGNQGEIVKALEARHDKTLRAGFDSHFVCVSRRYHYQAVRVEEVDYYELVVKEEAQVLPVAVVYFE